MICIWAINNTCVNDFLACFNIIGSILHQTNMWIIDSVSLFPLAVMPIGLITTGHVKSSLKKNNMMC